MPKPKKPKVPTIPSTGLYEGEAGANAANTDPLGFFNHVLGKAGRTFANTAPDLWDFLQNQAFGGFQSAYQQAQGQNQLLTLPQFANEVGVANPFAAASVVQPVTPTGGKRRRRR